MKILISALRFVRNRTYGGEVYFKSLLKALDKVKGDEADIVVASSPETCNWIKEIAPSLETIRGKVPTHNLMALIHEGLLVPKIAETIGAEVVFFPFNVMPKIKQPSVVMVHDLVNRYYLTNFPSYRPLHNWLLWKLVLRSIRGAEAIITPSNTVADEIRSLHIKEKTKVFPIREAVAVNITNNKECRLVSDNGAFILLQTGAKLPHKGQEISLHALVKLREFSPTLYEKIKLVITGGDKKELTVLRRLSEKLMIVDNVLFTGRVEADELEGLVHKASLVLFPTLYEGFGLGVIEAQKEGKAVIVSDIPVLREITGGAAAFFCPGDHVGLARIIKKLLTNEKERLQLEKVGPKKASDWTWDDHARALIEVLKKVSKE